MQISVVSQAGDKFAGFNLEANTNVETLKALVEAEMSIPVNRQVLKYKGKSLVNGKTLASYGIQDNDMLQVEAIAGSRQLTVQDIPPELFQQPAALQEFIKSNPTILQQLLHMDPTLAEAVLAPDASFLTSVLQQRVAERERQKAAEMKQIMELNADPLDPTAQAKIEQAIQQQNILENMNQAMEHNPEAFARVTMLYVPCQINGVDTFAFVDSGAQSTIMSKNMAQKLGIMRLVDTRFAGVAKGVGSAKIVGRIHAVQLRLGKDCFIQCSFSVLDQQGMDFLFGLDQLKRNRACIDLAKNALCLHGKEIPFLQEHELPPHLRHEEALADSKSTPSVPAASSSSQTNPNVTTTTNSGSNVAQPSGGNNTATPAPSNTAANSGSADTQMSQAPAQTGGFPEAAVNQLLSFGFGRNEVLQALRQCGGNVEAAASILFASQMGGF